MLKALFEVAVKSTGLGKAKGDLDAMGKSAQNAGKAHHTARDAAEAHYAVQAKGVIGTANSTKSFSKLASTMGEGGGIVGAYATLAANVFAVTAAFNALKGAAQVEQITRGLEVLGNRSGQTLGIVASQLRDITAGAVSTEQALRSTAQITAAGFKSDAVLRIGKLASDVSLALGRDMTDSIDRLTRGVIKLEPELLDELGLMTRLGEASAAYALQLGKPVSALTTLEKRQGFMNAVMAEGELKFGGVSDAAGNLKNYDKLAATFADLTKTVFGFINAIGGLNIAGFFADNMAVLGGAAILFLSTLKNQLLPGILSITASATKATAEARESALKEYTDTSKAHVSLGSNPAFLKPLADAGFENAGPQLYATAVKEATTEIEKQEKALKKLEAAKKLDNEAIAANKQLTRDYREGLQEVYQSQAANAALSKAEHAQSAVSAASNLSLMGTVRGIAASQRAYRLELELTNIAAGKTIVTNIGLQVSLHGVRLAAQAAGAALLSAMSWIGIAFAAIGGIIAAVNALQSAEQKLENKKAKELSEIYGQLGDKLKELDKINKSAVSANLARQAAITLESNAIKELADKYQELIDARAANDAPGSRTDSGARANSRANWWEVAGGALSTGLMGVTGNIAGGLLGTTSGELASQTAESFSSARLGVNRGSSAIGVIDNAQDAQAFQAIEQLRPEKAAILLEVIKDLDSELQSAKINEVFQEINKEMQKLAEVTARFDAALLSLNGSLKSLATDALPKTPFDAAVKDIQTFNKSLSDLIATADTADINIKISSIDAVTASYLTNAAQIFITDTRIVENLTQQERTLDGINETQKRSLDSARQRLAVSDYTKEKLQEESIALQHSLQFDQERAIILSNRNKLLSAQIDDQKAANAYSVEGLQHEMDMQNSILANENAILDIQKKQLETQLRGIDNSILLLKTQLENNIKVRTEQADAVAHHEKLLELAKRREASELTSAGLRRGIDFSAEHAAALAEADAINQRDSSVVDALLNDQERAAINGSILELENQRRVIALGIQSIELAQTANNIKSLSVTEQQVALDALRLKIAERGRKVAEEIRTIYQNVTKTMEDFDNLRANRSATEIAILSANSKRATTLQTIQASADEEQRKLKADFDAAQVNATASVAAANQRNYDTQRAQNVARVQALTAEALITEEIQVRTALYFSEYKEGLEWQKQSLDMLQRTTEAQNDVTKNLQEESRIRRELARRREGIAATADTTAAEELITQTNAHKLLVDGLEMKRALIELEFALLEQQRTTLLAELRLRSTSNDITDRARAQLEESIGRLASIDFNAAAALRIKAEEQLVRNSALSLQLNATPERAANRFDLRGIFAGMQDIQNARSAANAEANDNTVARTITTVLPGAIQDAARAPASPEMQSVRLQQDMANSLMDLVANSNEEMRVLRARAMTTGINSSGFTSTAEMERFITETLRAGGLTVERFSSGYRTPEESARVGGAENSYHMRTPERDGAAARDVIIRNATRATYLEAQRLLRATGRFEEVLGKPHGTGPHLHTAANIGASVRANPAAPQIAAAGEEASAATTINNAVRPLYQTPQGGSEVLDAANDNRVNGFKGIGLDTSVSNLSKGGSGRDGGSKVLLTPSIREMGLAWDQVYATIFKDLESLGPEGKALAIAQAGISSFAQNIEATMDVFNNVKSTANDKIIAGAAIASSAISSLQGVLAAASEAKIAGIDREIAAEQKRDGKSAESVAKIAAMERKKDAIAKKSFDVNKKLMMAQAVISTAAAIAGTLAAHANLGIFAIPLAIAIGAMGAAQLAIIAGTSYQSSSAASTATPTTPSTLSIGKRGDSVDLAKNNPNAGGEIGYLRGARGRGSSSANYSLIGSAYGGAMPRGYGNTAFVVGEHGPETITPDTPITVRPSNDNEGSQRALPPVNINIQALDAKGVEEILYGQRGNIIGMLREAANNSGQTFLESVNTAVYNKPNVGRL